MFWTLFALGAIVIGLLVCFVGFAHGAEQVDIPVEVSSVEVDQAHTPRWEVARDVPHDKAAGAIAAGKKAGGMCHELAEERMVVCVFTASRSVGIDWDKLHKEMAVR
ncbi:hypothetical protein NPS53_08195 [Pseudomonas putida]|uniref:hypothetical protein n=1 Tax=Pseudomonas putida TaxID=303 RepID=UPI00236468A7|nr:hypothetical protein [Pseudomonas putida]MDD2139551.1 hypothetical protein [Pseudomonas putida]HDS1721474.1 hypothetical protein [Pseudomonas putida]